MVFGREEVQTYYNDKDQLILAAEFGDVFIVEDTSTLKVIKLFRKIKLWENSSFLRSLQRLCIDRN
jgi:hypothetical protein